MNASESRLVASGRAQVFVVRTERETGFEPANLNFGKVALYLLSYSRAKVILSGVLLELRPAELFGGPTTMAIRAPNITFRDLGLESRPGEMTHEPRDRTALCRPVAMIEFKDDRICLATVDAGMSDEVVENLLTALLAVDLPVSGGALQICWAVPSVMFT